MSGIKRTGSVIRAATERDADAVVALWTEAYFSEGEGGRDTPYDRGEFEATAAAAAHLLVAERDGEVVGVVALLGPDEPSRAVADEGEAELARLVVGSGARPARRTSACTRARSSANANGLVR